MASHPLSATGGRQTRTRRILQFDGAAAERRVGEALRGAAFEAWTRAEAERRGLDESWAEVVLVSLDRLNQDERRIIERLRAVRQAAELPVLVFGLGTPLETAMAKGRRWTFQAGGRERRGGRAHRQICDDFISTPFDISRFLYLVEAWEVALGSGRVCASGDRNPTLDGDVAEALAVLGGSMLVEQLVTSLADALPQTVAGIRQSLASGDLLAMREAARSLKATTGLFGDTRPHEIAALLEAMGGAGAQDGTLVLAERLEEMLGDVCAAIEDSADSDGASSAAGQSGAAAAAVPAGVDLAGIQRTFRGRQIAGQGLDPGVGSRLELMLAALGCGWRRTDDSEWFLSPRAAAGGPADLRILGLGREQAAQAARWRAAIEAWRGAGAAVLLVQREEAAELEPLRAVADAWVAPPGALARVLEAAYRPLSRRAETKADEKAEEPAVGEAGRSDATGQAQDRAGQVLVAEDDSLTAVFITRALETAGFGVNRVATGQAAIEALVAGEFAAAVLDTDLPEIDGYGVLAHLRRHPRHKALPVVVLSGRTQEKDVLKALELGADEVLTKPFNPPEMILRLRKTLARR